MHEQAITLLGFSPRIALLVATEELRDLLWPTAHFSTAIHTSAAVAPAISAASCSARPFSSRRISLLEKFPARKPKLSRCSL
jgi:hypothetical protein